MFSADLYTHRRQCLKADVRSGLILLLGNRQSPINAPDNCHFFRQDSKINWNLRFAMIKTSESRSIPMQ